MSKSYFFTAAKISLVLLVICAAVSGVVSFVFSMTIDAYNLNLKNEQKIALQGIFAESDEDVIDFEEMAYTAEGVNAIYDVSSNLEHVGYCVNITGKGFGGDMTLMIGYNTNGSLKGIKVISHAETPGVGTKALGDSHLSQYAGKSGELTVSKGQSADIVAVSGATISSKAIHATVNKANAIISELMKKQGGIE